MILLQSHSRFLLQTLLNRLQNLEKGVELDYHWVEFDDVRYHIQVSTKNPHLLLLSLSLPTPPPGTNFVGGLPFGAIEAIKASYGVVVQILDPPRDGFNLTLKLNFSKLPPDEEYKHAILVKIASVREVVLGAPLRVILKNLALRRVAPSMDQLVAVVHRPNESLFLFPQAEKVTVVFPMRFKDSVDTILATSFLQDQRFKSWKQLNQNAAQANIWLQDLFDESDSSTFPTPKILFITFSSEIQLLHTLKHPPGTHMREEFVEARRTAGLNNAPPCLWSPSPPLELKEAPAEALSVNAGFVSFVIFPRHVEGKKLDRAVWNLSTFHAYVSYHVKCSEGFMHTRMRRRVESLIQALDRAKPESEVSKKTANSRSFKRPVRRDK